MNSNLASKSRLVEISENPQMEAAIHAVAAKKALEPEPRTDAWFRERREQLQRQANEMLNRRLRTT